MALGGSDDVDVDSSYDLLNRCRPLPRCFLVSQEIGLERDHPGVGQEEGGIGWDQRRRRTNLVVSLAEERREELSELVAIQGNTRIANLRSREVNEAGSDRGCDWGGLPGR